MTLLCPECVDVHIMEGRPRRICKTCKGPVAALESSVAVVVEVPKPESMSSSLPDLFSYPFEGNGKWMILGGALTYIIIDYLPFAGTFLGVLMALYLCGYMIKLIASSGQGDKELPEWPELSDVWEDLFRPIFLLACTFLVCFSPMLLYGLYGDEAHPNFDRIHFIFRIVGFLYLPMGLLAVAMFDSLAALNPMVIISAICKVPGSYILACIVLFFTYWVEQQISSVEIPIYFFDSMIRGTITLYFLAVEMRILGLIHHVNRDKLGWFVR